MALLRHLKLVMTGVFWVFAVLFAYAVGRTTNDFDWPSFWAVIAVSGAGYALVATILWAVSGFRTRQWSP